MDRYRIDSTARRKIADDLARQWTFLRNVQEHLKSDTRFREVQPTTAEVEKEALLEGIQKRIEARQQLRQVLNKVNQARNRNGPLDEKSLSDLKHMIDVFREEHLDETGEEIIGNCTHNDLDDEPAQVSGKSSSATATTAVSPQRMVLTKNATFRVAPPTSPPKATVARPRGNALRGASSSTRQLSGGNSNPIIQSRIPSLSQSISPQSIGGYVERVEGIASLPAVARWAHIQNENDGLSIGNTSSTLDTETWSGEVEEYLLDNVRAGAASQFANEATERVRRQLRQLEDVLSALIDARQRLTKNQEDPKRDVNPSNSAQTNSSLLKSNQASGDSSRVSKDEATTVRFAADVQVETIDPQQPASAMRSQLHSASPGSPRQGSPRSGRCSVRPNASSTYLFQHTRELPPGKNGVTTSNPSEPESPQEEVSWLDQLEQPKRNSAQADVGPYARMKLDGIVPAAAATGIKYLLPAAFVKNPVSIRKVPETMLSRLDSITRQVEKEQEMKAAREYALSSPKIKRAAGVTALLSAEKTSPRQQRRALEALIESSLSSAMPTSQSDSSQSHTLPEAVWNVDPASLQHEIERIRKSLHHDSDRSYRPEVSDRSSEGQHRGSKMQAGRRTSISERDQSTQNDPILTAPLEMIIPVISEGVDEVIKAERRKRAIEFEKATERALIAANAEAMHKALQRLTTSTESGIEQRETVRQARLKRIAEEEERRIQKITYDLTCSIPYASRCHDPSHVCPHASHLPTLGCASSSPRSELRRAGESTLSSGQGLTPRHRPRESRDLPCIGLDPRLAFPRSAAHESPRLVDLRKLPRAHQRVLAKTIYRLPTTDPFSELAEKIRRDDEDRQKSEDDFRTVAHQGSQEPLQVRAEAQEYEEEEEEEEVGEEEEEGVEEADVEHPRLHP